MAPPSRTDCINAIYDLAKLVAAYDGSTPDEVEEDKEALKALEAIIERLEAFQRKRRQRIDRDVFVHIVEPLAAIYDQFAAGTLTQADYKLELEKLFIDRDVQLGFGELQELILTAQEIGQRPDHAAKVVLAELLGSQGSDKEALIQAMKAKARSARPVPPVDNPRRLRAFGKHPSGSEIASVAVEAVGGTSADTEELMRGRTRQLIGSLVDSE